MSDTQEDTHDARVSPRPTEDGPVERSMTMTPQGREGAMAGEFVSDIKEIRRRARAHVEQGPITAHPRNSRVRRRASC